MARTRTKVLFTAVTSCLASYQTDSPPPYARACVQVVAGQCYETMELYGLEHCEARLQTTRVQ